MAQRSGLSCSIDIYISHASSQVYIILIAAFNVPIGHCLDLGRGARESSTQIFYFLLLFLGLLGWISLLFYVLPRSILFELLLYWLQ